MNKYTPSEIEKKWQDFWDEHESFVCEDNSDKEKFYALVEFPYPSGQGLHVGHPRPYTALDIVSRMKRMPLVFQQKTMQLKIRFILQL